MVSRGFLNYVQDDKMCRNPAFLEECNTGLPYVPGIHSPVRLSLSVDWEGAVMVTTPGSACRDEGLSLFRSGRVREAIAKLEDALRLDDEDPQTHTYLGAAYNAANDKLHAVHHFEESVRLLESPNSLYNLGVAYESVHRIDEAVRQYRMAAELDPSYTKACDALQRLHTQYTAAHPIPPGG